MTLDEEASSALWPILEMSMDLQTTPMGTTLW